MLDFIFHHSVTLDDYLLLYRRSIIREQAFQYADDFEAYVSYFKTAVLLKVNIGKHIPYVLQIIKDDQKCYEESLLASDLGGYYSPDLFSSEALRTTGEQDFFIEQSMHRAESDKSDLDRYCSPPALNRKASRNSGIHDYLSRQITSNQSSIQKSIEEYYSSNVSEALQYCIKAEKIIYKRFILKGKLKHLFTDYLSPLIDLERSHKTSLFYDKKNQLKSHIDWHEYARRLLLKLITESKIIINVTGALKSSCKILLLHKVKHTSEDVGKEQYLEQLNLFLTKLDDAFNDKTIGSVDLSLSLEKASLVKVLWYICEHEGNLIHPFMVFLSNTHRSNLKILLGQLTKKGHSSALMIAITSNNVVAFTALLKIIKAMHDEDIYSLLNLKNSDGNNCLMLAASGEPFYVDALLDVNSMLPMTQRSVLLTDTNKQQNNAFMIATENPKQTLSSFYVAIISLEPGSIRKILLQKTKSSFTTLGLLIKYKSDHLSAIAPLFEHLNEQDIFLLLSDNVLPKQIDSKKVKSKNIKTSKIKRVKKIVLNHRRSSVLDSSVEINTNKEKNIFQYALTLRAEITSVGWKRVYGSLLRLLTQLSIEKRCLILGRQDKKTHSTLHLAFARSSSIAKMFVQYLVESLPAESSLALLTKMNIQKESALFILAKHHIESLTLMISSFAHQGIVDDAFNEKNYDAHTLLDVAILTQTQEERNRLKNLQETAPEDHHHTLLRQAECIMALVRVLQETLPEKNFYRLLSEVGRDDKSILTHARNINNRPLFVELVQFVLGLEHTRLRNAVIESIFKFELKYDKKSTCSTVIALLGSLNKAQNFHDLPGLTQTLNPHGWSALSSSIGNHPGKIIENVALYAEIKQSKFNLGEISSCFTHFWYYETPEQKINTARKFLGKLKEKENKEHVLTVKGVNKVISKMSDRERCILNHGRLKKIIEAYYTEEQKQSSRNVEKPKPLKNTPSFMMS